jgi:hypothetical protein
VRRFEENEYLISIFRKIDLQELLITGKDNYRKGQLQELQKRRLHKKMDYRN